MKIRFLKFSLFLLMGLSISIMSCNKDDNNNPSTASPNGTEGGQIDDYGFLKAMLVQNNDTVMYHVDFETSHIIGREAGEEFYEIFIPAINDNNELLTVKGRVSGVGSYEFVEDLPDDVVHCQIAYSDQNYKVYIPSQQYSDSYCTLNITEYRSPFPAFVPKTLKGNFSAIVYDEISDSKLEIINGEFQIYVTNWSGY